MRVVFLIVALSSVVRFTTGFCGKPPLRSSGFWGTVLTSFTGTDDLKTQENLRNAFIIARHGMVVPTDETYPTDWHYKGKWKKGRFTTHGKRMMTKLGRSLATRYESLIGNINGIKVTTMDTDYGEENAVELLKGLLPGKTKLRIERSNLDKFRLLRSPDECKAYETMKAEAMQNEKHAFGEPDFFYYLNKKIGVTQHLESVWYINSNQRVYNLWEVMDFERKSKQWFPWWCGPVEWTKMRSVVNTYLQDIAVNWKMPKYIVGRILKEVFDEEESKQVKMHIHVTNDLTFAAFKRIMVDGDVSAPEFGETLMVEVDTLGLTKVYRYRPYRKHKTFLTEFLLGKKISCAFSYIKELIGTFYDITNKLDEDAWKRICEVEQLRSPAPSGRFIREGHELRSLPSTESELPRSPLISTPERHLETGGRL